MEPTKIGVGASGEQQIDIALSVAWNAVVNGSWQEPLEWAKAKALQFEFLDYKKKYRESGIVSNEIRSLELIVNNFLGANYDLATIITKEAKELNVESVIIKENGITEEGGTIKERKEIDVRILDEVKAISDRAYDVESPVFPKSYFNTELFVEQNEFLGNKDECQSMNGEGSLYYNIVETVDSGLRKDNQYQEIGCSSISIKNIVNISTKITHKHKDEWCNFTGSITSRKSAVSEYELRAVNFVFDNCSVTERAMQSHIYDNAKYVKLNDVVMKREGNIAEQCNGASEGLLLKSGQYRHQTDGLDLDNDCQGTNNRSGLPLELKASLPSITLSDVDSGSPKTSIKRRSVEKYNHQLQLTLHNVSDDLLVKQGKHISKDFMKIDQALIEILKNLKKVD